MKVLLDLLPPAVSVHVRRLSPGRMDGLEEIRIRIGRPLEFVINGQPHFPAGMDTAVPAEDGIHLLNRLSDYSLYAFDEELKQGYITLQGGHRVGLAGKVITEKGRVKRIRDISSFNIRIARQKIGCAAAIQPYLFRRTWLNTMIIGPPQTGKTTIIRDLIRTVSNGSDEKGYPSMKVGVVDERSEIAGSAKGIPQHDVGIRTDILDACPKAEGLMMFIRSMSPDVLAADEIGRKADVEALMEAVHAGVKLFITVHGSSLEEIRRRPSLHPLFDLDVFDRFVILSRVCGPGSISSILDKDGQELYRKKGVAT
ncbi:stage III sporulation protein AA [Bacillus marinisedimentorum]|uniref:stage III sporulation protein AA n=1 Tax=Bacillus marinisedimentorum TaxID=1821260 RepID=UPI000871DB9E|nr:stage III sporulation protein AA [Bacillus marinisedimentorum]